ncbi:MAG: hypothetical protein M3Q69_21285 [Acidobacteriota bacterium]|nr:hypothetical protein [Acidobacteriota bacterium]
MARYIKKFRRVGSIGPTEERGFGVWAGYELVGIDGDLSEAGLVNVDDWPEDRIAAHGIATFLRVEPGDAAMYEKLGIRR